MKYLFFEPTLLTSVGGVQTCAWNLALEMHRSGREVYLITGQGALPCPYPELSAQIMAFPFIDRKHFSKALGRRLPRIREGMSLVSASWDFLKKHASDSALIVFKPHDITGFGSRLKEFKTVCLHSEGTDFVALDRFYAKKYITKISAASHFNAWQIRSHFKRPVHVVYNGVPEYFIEAPVQPDLVQNWRKKMGADMGTRVFGYVGRMVGWKGLDVFLKAMSMAQPNGLQPKEELWLIGDGPQLAGWLELARQLGISDRVKPHPFVPHHTLPGLWDAIDIGVFPSSGDEAFGITIAEAMSRGKAVIASYVGGIPEVVGNENQCGWLCENSNAEAFAAAIVAAREADLQAMGNNGRGRVATQFRWSKLAEQFGLFLG